MRIIFMGTRDIAVPALRTLIGSGRPNWHVVAVVTQPDRAAGRSRQPAPSPVKTLAAAAGIPVFQPESWKGADPVATLHELAPDVGVVASYAQLLPRRVLRIPNAGWLNIHPSLLPRHRGPSPVAATILAGDPVTGVTIIKLVSAMDAGPIVAQAGTPLQGDETTGTLTARLGDLGAQLLTTVLDDWVGGHVTALAQDGAAATYSQLLTRQDGLLDWSRPASDLERRVRAYSPWPGTFTFYKGRRLAILSASPIPTPSDAPPGTVLGLEHIAGGMALPIATGSGRLAARRLQLEGRKDLAADEFTRGQPGILEAVLGA